MSTVVLVVALGLSLVVNIGLVFVALRLSRRVLEFDDLFDLLSHDIEMNVKFFEKLLATPLFENSLEVKTANRNMGIISQRLREFSLRLAETSNRKTKEG